MKGYVLTFRPTTGEGTIVTDTGDSVRFTASPSRADLEGGDRVSFELSGGGRGASVHEVRILQKGTAHLMREDPAAIRRLYSIVQLRRRATAATQGGGPFIR